MKFEYKAITLPFPIVQRDLDKLGRARWEMVTAVAYTPSGQVQNFFCYYFKREIYEGEILSKAEKSEEQEHLQK